MTKYEIISVVLSLASAGLAAYAMHASTKLGEDGIYASTKLGEDGIYASTKLGEDGIYVTAINTRISTCMDLSTYHRDNVNKDSASQKPPIGDNLEGQSGSEKVAGESRPLSSPIVRGQKAADIARALTLCLVDYENIDGIKLCVGRANTNRDHFVRDIIVRGSNGAPDKLDDNLAC